jgi:hypothetical protein
LPWWQRARQGAAIAGSIDGSGVIHGCYDRAGKAGSHTVVLQDAGATCPGGTTAISWNQTGPHGPAASARLAGPGPGPAAGGTGLSAGGLTGDQVVTAGPAKRESEDLV